MALPVLVPNPVKKLIPLQVCAIFLYNLYFALFFAALDGSSTV